MWWGSRELATLSIHHCTNYNSVIKTPEELVKVGMGWWKRKVFPS